MANYGNKRKNPFGFTAPYINRTAPTGKRRRAMYMSNSYFQGKKYRSGVAKSRNNNIKRDLYKFKRSCILGSIGSSTGGEVVWAGQFGLGNLPAVSDFTALFDRYRITHIQLQFYLKYEPGSGVADPGTNQQNATYPIMYIVKDYDDAIAPTNINYLREHAKMKMIPMQANKIVKFDVKPATLSENYRSSIATTYSPKWKEWIDMAHTDTPYYGVKAGWENFFGVNQTIQVRATYWFECKDTR